MSCRVLVGCEFSGIVRNAFNAFGHDAISCDLIPSETPGPHYQGNIADIIDQNWDMMIVFPPCTHLSLSGARWWPGKQFEQKLALGFIRFLLGADIPYICLENPVGKISTAIRPPDQYIHPWQFGHGEKKKTGLWLKGLPKLKPTKIVSGRVPRVHMEAPGKDRWKRRSRFYPGMAKAMAHQWGDFVYREVYK